MGLLSSPPLQPRLHIITLEMKCLNLPFVQIIKIKTFFSVLSEGKGETVYPLLLLKYA